MTNQQLFRLCGLGLVVGAVLSAVSNIVSGVLFPDMADLAAVTSPLNTALGAIGVLGSVCALLGLPGAYARVAREGGVVWLLGCVFLALTGLLFGVFMGLTGIVVFTAIAARAPDLLKDGPPPSFYPVFILGTLFNVLGPVLMAVPIIRRRVMYPTWTGYALLIGALLAVAGIFTTGPASQGALVQILNMVS